MAIIAGIFLYGLLLILVLALWRPMRSETLARLIERSEAEHHLVLAVIAEHTRGGTWKQFSEWLRQQRARAGSGCI